MLPTKGTKYPPQEVERIGGRKRASNPSPACGPKPMSFTGRRCSFGGRRPVSPRLMRAPVASHPLPGEREVILRAHARPAMITTFSQGRRWTATGVLPSRRGPDEGSLPPPRPPVACPAQPRVGRYTTEWIVSGLLPPPARR
jgi:hypothetical protein